MTDTTLPLGRFEGRDSFQQLVRDALATAAREGWREIILADADFGDWPLGERAVAQALHDWSASGRRCVLLAKRYDEVMAPARPLRAVGAAPGRHIIDARGCPGADILEMPSAIWSPGWVLQRLDLERSNGYTGAEPERRLALHELLNEWLKKSSPAFPATTLGL